MSIPLIGLTGRRRLLNQIEGFPGSLGHLRADLFLSDYSDDVVAAGGLPVLLPVDGDPEPYMSRLDGIVFTGGADIEPHRYNQEPDGQGGYEPERDDQELALVDLAIDHGLAVLGICRGLQLLNVHAGGTLHQDVPAHSRYDVDPAGAVHGVRFSQPSRLHLLYGEQAEVNSLHHQTIDRLGSGLQVTGRADDGTIEALEMPGCDVIAIQWHPEMRNGQEPVFDWLIKQATRVGASR